MVYKIHNINININSFLSKKLVIVDLIMSDIPSTADFVTSPETASPFNLSNLSTAFGDIQTPQLGTNLFNSQSSSILMASDEAISNAQSLATGSVVPIANSQPVVSIDVDTTETFSFEKSFLLPDVIRNTSHTNMLHTY